MVDALVSGASGESRAGSSPVLGTFAAIAQLVEHNLAKVGVASSSLVCRSKFRDKFTDFRRTCLFFWRSLVSARLPKEANLRN